MKKMINFRNCLIAVLCITIICLSIGFVVLSIKLKDKEEEVSVYDLSFVSVEKKSSVKGSNIEPVSTAEIEANKKEILFTFDMNSNNDEIVYVANIRNSGNMKVRIVDIMQSPDYSIDPYKTNLAPVIINLSDLKDKIIEPGKEVELRISISYDSKSNVNTKKKFNYRIGLITQYVE